MGFKEHSRCFAFFAAPAGLSKGRAFREHKNRTRRQHSVEVNQGFRCFLFQQLALDFEKLHSNPEPMCHSPGCLQAVNRGGGHTGKLKLPSSCRFACLALQCLCFPPLASCKQATRRRSRQRAHGSLHDDGYRPPQPVATGSTARTAKPAVISEGQTPAPLTSLLFFIFRA